MRIDLPVAPGVQVQIAPLIEQASAYPTARIQKGLVLLCDGQDLSEEAVGFGVPIVKCGLQSIFPSQVDIYLHGACNNTRFSARYRLDLEERISRNGKSSIKNHLIYAGKNSLAAVIRQIPPMRKFLTSTSNLLRSQMDWQTVYEASEFTTYVVMTYSVNESNGRIKVELTGGDFLASCINEIIVMNELGAHHFDRYQESNGISQEGDKIGCWDPVSADEAAFTDQAHKLSFSLPQVSGARLYRGRELVDSRLAWSGFGYSFTPGLEHFNYEITITRGS